MRTHALTRNQKPPHERVLICAEASASSWGLDSSEKRCESQIHRRKFLRRSFSVFVARFVALCAREVQDISYGLLNPLIKVSHKSDKRETSAKLTQCLSLKFPKRSV